MLTLHLKMMTETICINFSHTLYRKILDMFKESDEFTLLTKQKI